MKQRPKENIWPATILREAQNVDRQDLRGVGINNAQLEHAAGRITKGATWKRQRIVAVMPTADLIPARVVHSLLCLAHPTNQAFTWHFALGEEVGEAYSKAFADVLTHPEFRKWEFILTVEHDMVVEWNSLLKLLERADANPEFTAISALYWTRGYGSQPQIWGDPEDPVVSFRPQPPRPGELVECNGIGMGFALWRIAKMKDKRLRRPFFKTEKGTQDLYFWNDARQHGHRCAVDCAVPVGHYDAETEVAW